MTALVIVFGILVLIWVHKEPDTSWIDDMDKEYLTSEESK